MSIRVQDLMSNERTITVETKAGDLHLTYRPSAYVADLEDRAMRYIETNRPYSSLAEGLSMLITQWDITGFIEVRDETGEVTGTEEAVLPIDLETMRSLPGELLVLMQNAINNDMKPNPDELKNSGAGSRRKGKLANAQSGIR